MGFEVSERTETMTIYEVARVIEWIRAKGMSDKDACDLIRYIAGRNENGVVT